MYLKKSVFTGLSLLLFTTGFAQQKEGVRNYISQYSELAIAEMKRTGVPAAITLAQGIHESGAGNSELARASHNHFGIKCKSNWTGPFVRHDDDAKGECFRKYSSPEDSYRDHSDFLLNGQRYAFLFSLAPDDYKGWAKGLKQAGYATNPKYPEVLIKLVEDYNLQAYTMTALGKTTGSAISAVVEDQPSGRTVEPGPAPVINLPAPVYPEGVFSIHDTKVIYARKGTSWLSLAQQYGTDLSKLFDFNDREPAEVLESDQLVYLQRKRKTGNAEYHVVQPGETLYSIAQLQAIRLESLKELNWLRGDDRPAPGEKLSLKTKATVMPKLMIKENYPLVPAAPGKGTH